MNAINHMKLITWSIDQSIWSLLFGHSQCPKGCFIACLFFHTWCERFFTRHTIPTSTCLIPCPSTGMSPQDPLSLSICVFSQSQHLPSESPKFPPLPSPQESCFWCLHPSTAPPQQNLAVSISPAIGQLLVLQLQASASMLTHGPSWPMIMVFSSEKMRKKQRIM